MKFGKLIVAATLLALPTTAAWAGHPSVRSVGHCASCGIEAPSCGCDDVVHCTTCAPRCGCACGPGLIPGLLKGVDRMLTGLFTCHCRPRCCDVACVEPCGNAGCSDCFDGGGYHPHPHEFHPTPASDVLSNPFEDDPISPQARYRQPYRSGASYNRRVSRAPQQQRTPTYSPRSRYPHRTAATSPVAAPRTRAVEPRVAPVVNRDLGRVAQVVDRTEANQKPRILKVEYAKPIITPKKPVAQPSVSAEPKPLAATSRSANAIRLGSTPSTPARSNSGIPVNPLR